MIDKLTIIKIFHSSDWMKDHWMADKKALVKAFGEGCLINAKLGILETTKAKRIYLLKTDSTGEGHLDRSLRGCRPHIVMVDYKVRLSEETRLAIRHYLSANEGEFIIF